MFRVSFYSLFLLLCFGGAHALFSFTPPAQNMQSTQSSPMFMDASIWSTDYQSALQQAQRENKALLLFFTGSNWCTWCNRLEQEVLDRPECLQTLTPYFVFVKLDYQRPNVSLSPQLVQQTEALKRKYDVTRYPTVVVINAQERVLGKTGYLEGGPSRFNETILRMLQ